MDSMVKALLSAGDHLFSKRMSLLSLWQEIAEQFYPERAEFTSVHTLGEEFADHLMASDPLLVRRDLGDAINSMLRQGDWFRISTNREDKQDHSAKEWLEWASQVQKRAMYDPRAHFTRAVKEGDHDYAAFGQCGISVELNSQRTLLYRCWHLRDLAWCENSDLEIDTFHLKQKMTARDMVKMFPKTAHEKVKECVEKEPYKEFNVRRIVIPADGYETPIGKKWRTPFVSVYVDQDNQTILEEAGSNHKVFCVPRWQTVSGSQYAHSPATIIALPDARLMQQMTLTLLEAAEKAVNPPMIAYMEALRSDIDTRAGGVSWIDAAYDDRTGAPIQPLFNDKTGIPIGLEVREQIRQKLAQAFYLDKLVLPPPGDMTAYEFSHRIREFARQTLPMFGPMEAEYNGQLCNMTFEVMMAENAFASRPIPDSIAGQEVEFRFESPISSAREQEKVTQFQQVAELMMTAAGMDPTTRFNVDINKSFRDAVGGTGSPAEWLNTEDETAAMIAQEQQKMQAQQAMAAMRQAGATAEQAGKAEQALNAA